MMGYIFYLKLFENISSDEFKEKKPIHNICCKFIFLVKKIKRYRQNCPNRSKLFKHIEHILLLFYPLNKTKRKLSFLLPVARKKQNKIIDAKYTHTSHAYIFQIIKCIV